MRRTLAIVIALILLMLGNDATAVVIIWSLTPSFHNVHNEEDILAAA